MVAVAVNPGKQVNYDVFKVRDVPLASGIIQAVAEVTKGGEAAAGLDEALDYCGGFGRLSGIPVVGDGFGDAAELDDGEFEGEPALEDVDAAADLGKGHGITSDGSFFYMDKGDGQDWVYGWDGGDFGEIPLVSAHFR